jgi:hypothetical protein
MWRGSYGKEGARANLTRANLTRADLTGADLTGADLTGADLTGADLTDANLTGADLTLDDVPAIDRLDSRILEQVDANPLSFCMATWHEREDGEEVEAGEGCGTTHCRAGWAIHLAGKSGYELEAKVGSQTAGTLIYLKNTGRVPNFFANNDDALADIRACAAREATL